MKITFGSQFCIGVKDDKRESLVDWLEKKSTERQKANKRRQKLDKRKKFKLQNMLTPIIRLNDAKNEEEEAKANLMKVLLDASADPIVAV